MLISRTSVDSDENMHFLSDGGKKLWRNTYTDMEILKYNECNSLTCRHKII